MADCCTAATAGWAAIQQVLLCMQEQIEHKIQLQQGEDQFQELSLPSESRVDEIFRSFSSVYQCSLKALSQVATNIMYTAKHSSCPFVQRRPVCLQPKGPPAYLLGTQYSYESREAFELAFQSVIWISYGQGGEQSLGDVGWGCMVRVCQMLLAQALRLCLPDVHTGSIIAEFASTQAALFSFQKICLEGNIMQRWSTSTEVIMALQELLSQQSKYRITINMYTSVISEEEIGPEKNYPLLLIVSSRLGEKTIDQSMKDHMFEVLSHRSSIGAVVGIGNEAIYVAGFHDENFIALDPHYVQPENEESKTYFHAVARGVHYSKAVPVLDFCFLFQSAHQHREWFDDMAAGVYIHAPYNVLQCDECYGQQVYRFRHPLRSTEIGQFQTL